MVSPDDEAAQPPSKRPRRDPEAEEDAAQPPPPRVELNPADCDLDFDVGGGGLQGSALHEGGFAYCWSGARATVGARGGGKYCFGCRIVAEQPVEMDLTAPEERHLCRIGVSRGDGPVGALGESDHSFGFGGTGKFSHQRRFVDYGVKFGVGDTIVCAVDLDSKPMASIGFARNGEWLGIAKHFDAGEKGLGLVDAPVKPMQWESALFPHVLLKNVVVEMQFSREDGLEPVDGYVPWASAFADGNAVCGPLFEQSECEVMMMVGLPASGKSTWAEKWVKEHPEKRFILLGTNLALEQMKVPGLLRKNNYGERFDRLMECATWIFNKLLKRAANTPHNFIIDQTNVYKNARIRKLRPFANYRKTAVVVFPSPSELKSRAAKRFNEMGKEVPAEAINEMTANFVLPLSKPDSKEPFDAVIFTELSRYEAQRNLDEMQQMLPRTRTPSYGNTSNQIASSIYAVTAAPVDPRARSCMASFHPPMANSYGSYSGTVPGSAATFSTGVHTVGNTMQQQAPSSFQRFQSPTGNQHEIHSGYLSAPNQYQMPSSYPSNPNKYQFHGSYQSTPLPGYGQSTYGSHGNPSPYNPNPYNPEMSQCIQAPMTSRNLYQAPGSTEAYGVPGYAAANLIGRPHQVPPPTLPAYSSQPVAQWVPNQDSSSSWSYGSYRPSGQQSDVHHLLNAASATPPTPWLPHSSAPNHMNQWRSA
ncbi:Heterogeneous nuclear ribonucleoprotein U-like protein 1 [Dichanthelium oligosanthes]|uniref:Heterogeneous nuclear ribonucleoprotein U-like protein 1 n=1 Tax=Dichanthelium oligosanthes TaxID=888268 RepID=A0A1E5UL83_9POAL|nr:Heterogeneous nuclear ribonucleoprotein U-like protein 1 [Dichanthelium oligosanthes]